VKTISVEIEKHQTLRFFVNVPDHWGHVATRRALTYPIVEEIAEKADSFDWNNSHGGFQVAALYDLIDGDVDQIDYSFPDEPAPAHSDQLSLIPNLETAL